MTSLNELINSTRPLSARWTPRVTVAAVIEKNGKFLLVEERVEGNDTLVLNHPAGHLEQNESLVEACIREVLEETAYPFMPKALLGIYLARRVPVLAGEDISYLRFAFVGEVGEAIENQALDQGIERAVWLSEAELRAETARHRSPVVMECTQDYLNGKTHPLDLLYTDRNVYPA